MDEAKTDLEKIIKINIKNKEFIEDKNYYKLLKETIIVLIDLKKYNLYHMDIKPCNILISEGFIEILEDALEIEL